MQYTADYADSDVFLCFLVCILTDQILPRERSSQEPATNCAANPKVPQSAWIQRIIRKYQKYQQNPFQPFPPFSFFPHYSPFRINRMWCTIGKVPNLQMQKSNYWVSTGEDCMILYVRVVMDLMLLALLRNWPTLRLQTGSNAPHSNYALEPSKANWQDSKARYKISKEIHSVQAVLGLRRFGFTRHDKISRTRMATVICKSN